MFAEPQHADANRLLARLTLGPRPWLALVALCLVLWLPGFFTLPPGDRDESRFAQASKQMLETGDFVQIRNGLVARNQKPIGIYWLQAPFAAAAHSLHLATGNPIWPYRMPSLLGGLIAVLAAYGFGRRLIAPEPALLGAAFLAASLILTTEVHIAKTDAALLAATTIALGLMSRAYLDAASLRLPAALAFWAALGAGILLKGPITPMVAALTALALALLDWRRAGRPRWLASLRPKLGLPLLLLIVLPWFIAIGFATHGTFFAQSFGHDLGGKLTGADDAHGAIPGLHLLLLPLLAFAAGPAAIAAVPSIWRDRKQAETRFLLAWLIPTWVVFEVVRTKLPHYPLPLYPAACLLAARWFCEPAAPARRSGFAALACALAIVAAVVTGFAAVALPVVATSGLAATDLLGLPGLLVAGVLTWLLVRAWPDARRAALVMLCATPLLYGALFGLELPLLRPLWIAPRVAEALRQHWPNGRPAGAMFGELGYAEPSLMFLCGTDTQHVGDAGTATRFLSGHPDAVLLVDERGLAAVSANLHASVIAVIKEYNYSRGRKVELTLLEGTVEK